MYTLVPSQLGLKLPTFQLLSPSRIARILRHAMFSLLKIITSQEAPAGSRPSDQFRTASSTFFLYSCWVLHWSRNTSYLALSSFLSCLSLSGWTAVAGLLIRHI